MSPKVTMAFPKVAGYGALGIQTIVVGHMPQKGLVLAGDAKAASGPKTSKTANALTAARNERTGLWPTVSSKMHQSDQSMMSLSSVER